MTDKEIINALTEQLYSLRLDAEMAICGDWDVRGCPSDVQKGFEAQIEAIDETLTACGIEIPADHIPTSEQE